MATQNILRDDISCNTKMKFWQLFLISMLAMAAMVQAQEQPPEDVEPEENGDDEGHAEPEAEPAAEDGAGDEDDGAAEPEPEGTDEPQEVDAGNGDDEQSAVQENHPDHINEVETKAVEMEEVIESSKTAGLESDSGATSACFSFSTVILSTLVALKFAH
ncbi:retinitis pigmentosa 1-like 1 protein isoform X1 [Palaemon carinicauda]|uniref:retinitis pigmentosa 1-like 1 protein isoform X1 n=2 Tax=Palaemon carinicauda TaxID=392227 RepID=UPI0035B5DEEC